jgi:hypothetical protein
MIQCQHGHNLGTCALPTYSFATVDCPRACVSEKLHNEHEQNVNTRAGMRTDMFMRRSAEGQPLGYVIIIIITRFQSED